VTRFWQISEVYFAVLATLSETRSISPVELICSSPQSR